MKPLQSAACKRRRNSGLLLLSLALLCAFHSKPANAASLIVKMRQLNPDGQLQQVTCSVKQKCVLPIDIQTGQTKETLTVGILFVPNGVAMRFQTPEGFLFTGEREPTDKYSVYEGDWHDALATGNSKTSVTTLFIPLRQYPKVGLLRGDMKQPVTDLEITTEQLP